MKKFKITEEQIKTIYECTSVKNQEQLEDWFPEAFKPQLEVGKWYHYSGWLICFTGIKDDAYKVELLQGYGFDKEMRFRQSGNFGSNPEEWVLATYEEVKEALINEAERRGFKKGINFKEIKDQMNCDYFPGKIRSVGSMFDFSENKLYTSGFGKWCIFKDGVWAEIVKEPVTLNYQQIADKFGIDVEQLRITK